MSKTTRGIFNDPDYLNEIVRNKYGKLTVLSFDHFKDGPPRKDRANPRRFAMYKCQCDCGNITYVERNNLINGRIISCGCSNRRPENNNHIGSLKGKLDDPEYLNEIVGKKYNMLTVLRFDHFRYGNIPAGKTKPRKEAIYLCKCDCGNTTLLERHNITNGYVKSCGCINYLAQPKHGDARKRIYKEWQNMKNRCYNSNTDRWKDYGGRGITVCDEWLGKTPAEGFTAFRDWAYANGYSDELSIDRIDNDGPYAPWNCRWVTAEEQNWNKRNNTIVHDGTIRDLYNDTNTTVDISNVQRRFSNNSYDNFHNWSDNDKLFIPPNYGRDAYRKDHNIKDVFVFDEDSPYKK